MFQLLDDVNSRLHDVFSGRLRKRCLISYFVPSLADLSPLENINYAGSENLIWSTFLRVGFSFENIIK